MNKTHKESMMAATWLAIKRFGGVEKAAAYVGVSVQSVYRWRRGEVLISAENAIKLAQGSGLALADFRPDLGGDGA